MERNLIIIICLQTRMVMVMEMMMMMTKISKTKWLVVISCLLEIMKERKPEKKKSQMNLKTQIKLRDFFEKKNQRVTYNIEKAKGIPMKIEERCFQT
jgi:hypothetical protein